MAIRNKQIKSVVKTLPPLVYGDDELHVSYYVNAYTPRAEQLVDEEGSAGMVLLNMCLPLIAEWDLEDEYEVWQYEAVGDIEDGYSVPPLPRRFVVKDKGGRLGEWDQQQVREEFKAGAKKNVLYQLKQVYEDGEPLMQMCRVPVTKQGLLDVPHNVFTDIIRAVGQALTPGEAKSANSDSSFG